MNFKKLYYFYSLFFVFTIPVLIETYFVWQKIEWGKLAIFLLGITFIGGLWDIWATRHGRKDPIWLWQFNKEDTLGITIFDLPIEEYFFYIVTTSYIIITWEAIQLSSEMPILNVVVPAVSLWSLIFIAVPYWVGRKKDKYLN